MAQLLQSIVVENEVRTSRAREIVGALYFFVGSASFFLALTLSILQAWLFPLRGCRCLPFQNVIEIVTVYHIIAMELLLFTVASSGGFVGFSLITLFYFIWLVVLTIFVLVYRHNKFKELEDSRAPHRGDGTDTADRLDLSVAPPGTPSNNPLNRSVPSRAGSVVVASQPPAAMPASSNSVSLMVLSPAPSDPLALSRADRSMSISKQQHQLALVKVGQRPAMTDGQEITDEQIKKMAARWTFRPHAISTSQLRFFCVSLIGILISLTTLLVLGFAYRVENYYVVVPVSKAELAERKSGDSDLPIVHPAVEFQPRITAMALMAMYSFPRLATDLRMQPFVDIFTTYCGDKYRKSLSGDEKKSEIYDNWIATYSINMSIYNRTHYSQFDSVNDWFIRALRADARPIDNASRVLSPADCRTLVYDSIPNAVVWLKGATVTARQLTANAQVVAGIPSTQWDFGSMLISRLAPQDYHRFHAPVAGQILEIKVIPGVLWSVGADAARSDNDIFLNKRIVVIIAGSQAVGPVAFIAIGATCVGSIVLVDETGAPWKVGRRVEAGAQLGYFQFGGSTIVTLFSPGRVRFDEQLLYRSRFPVETLVEARSALGETAEL